jgi:predicted RNA-binding protein with PIN domain
MYVIDGYNLLHAMQILPDRLGPHVLEQGRRRLLSLLARAYATETDQVIVVFDAAGAPAGASRCQTFRGIDVRYAPRGQEADDLIEDFIRHAGAPRQLVVVSDDHRLRQAIQRRHGIARGCIDYLEDLEGRLHRQAPPLAPAEKPPVAPAEVPRWLKIFADLDEHADMKELFDPYPFEQPDA